MTFQNIDEYMLLSREQRRAHLKLDEDCIAIGGASKEFRGLLAHSLKTNIPKGRYIFLCHACHNAGCSNTNHLYWGNRSDNAQDYKVSGTFISFKDRTIAKHGEERYLEIIKIAASKGGKGNKKNLP